METFNPQTGVGMDDDPTAAPADGGQFNTLGAGSMPVRRKRLSDTTVVLIGTVVLGGAILMGMRWIGTRASIFKVDATVEKTVNEFLTKLSGNQTLTGLATGNAESDLVMSNLTVDRTESQVPLSMVKRNPFVLAIKRKVKDDGSGMTPVDDAKAREEARLVQRRAELDRLVGRMRLSSIMGQRGNRVAVLNNLVVQAGDVIDEVFEIAEINSFDILIRAEGFEFRKSLAE
jgi:hypothetical protein